MKEPLYFCSRTWIPVDDSGHCWPAYFGVVATNIPEGKHYIAEIDHSGFLPIPRGWQVKSIDLDGLYDFVRDSAEPWSQIQKHQFDKLLDSYIMPPFGNNEH